MIGRLLHTVRNDAVIQFRSGFYFVGATVAFFVVGLLRLIPEEWPLNLRLLIPAALLLNVMTTTFYFVAGLVLLEKSQGTLAALVVTPLRVGEYLGSKAATLAFLAMAENAVVLLLFYGVDFEPVVLLVGMTALCVFYTLIGFAAVSRYDSINQFLMPSAALVTVLTLPLLEHFGFVGRMMYVHPVQPYLVLIRSAFTAVSAPELVYAMTTGAAWLAVAYIMAKRAFAGLAIR